MHIVDSCGWLEWFTNGHLAESYGKYLEPSENLLVPVVILYEVYKILKREIGEEKSLPAIGYMKNSLIVPIDDILALKAADIALENRLAMADAMVYATSVTYSCPLYTSDVDFKDLPLVHYFSVEK